MLFHVWSRCGRFCVARPQSSPRKRLGRASSSHAWRAQLAKYRAAKRWLHEIKFDGYRVQVHLKNSDAKIFTRRGHDRKSKRL
ncbi:MAG: hypothetical protein JO051_00170 [Acidobacteriaceae bacterium]|nr:hypothetical protein [Acidobacteriaceae bacterium]